MEERFFELDRGIILQIEKELCREDYNKKISSGLINPDSDFEEFFEKWKKEPKF